MKVDSHSTLPGEAAEYACVGIILVHILESCSRRRFAKIDTLIRIIGAPNEHKTPASYATMVHSDHSNAEDRADKLSKCQYRLGEVPGQSAYCVGRIAALFEQIDSNLTADAVLTRNGSEAILNFRLRAAPGESTSHQRVGRDQMP